MLVRCQRFGDWFLFGLVWQYSSIQKNIIKVGAKSWMLTCSCHITLSLPFYTDPDSKRELNFCNGYLSLLYFWIHYIVRFICIFFWLHRNFLLSTAENNCELRRILIIFEKLTCSALKCKNMRLND